MTEPTPRKPRSRPRTGPGVKIGLDQIYEVVVDTRDKVAELGHSFAKQGEELDDLQTRVARLERLVWIAAGAALAGGGVLGSLLGG